MERFGPTRRGGPVFRWLGEPLAIDLGNTVMVVREGESVDLLGTPPEFESWLELERPHLGDCRFALPHLPEIRRAREDVRALLAGQATEDQIDSSALARINAASRDAPLSPQLEVGSDGVPRMIHVPEDVDSLPALLGAVARSAIQLVADHEEAPLNVCAAPSCGMFFVGRRRWCCSACGNRARAARHYRRRAGLV
jgi:predicted RNA-binding Zn ribbon-like protein